jgi:hypothetical protein
MVSKCASAVHSLQALRNGRQAELSRFRSRIRAGFKAGMAVVLFAAVGIARPGTGDESFHSGGVGPCDGCHTMHRSQQGLPAGGGSSAWLLQGSDPSSICLNCHAGPGDPESPAVFSPDGSALTPGGDFYWLTKDFRSDRGPDAEPVTGGHLPIGGSRLHELSRSTWEGQWRDSEQQAAGLGIRLLRLSASSWVDQRELPPARRLRLRWGKTLGGILLYE